MSRSITWHLAGVLAGFALCLALAGTASAETSCSGQETGKICYFTGKIPAGTQTGNGVVGNIYEIVSTFEGGTAPTHCIAPVNWNGSKFVAPYGWKCGGGQQIWQFATISAMSGEYNNSSGTDKFSNAGYYKN